MSLYQTSHWATDAAKGKPRLFSPNIWPCHWLYSLCVQASCNLASSPIVLWCHSPSVSDATIPPPGVFSCSPSSSVNLQHASLTLDHPPIYQSLVFISSPSPSFSRHPSLCCSTSPFSILFPSTTHSAFITSLSFPSLFFSSSQSQLSRQASWCGTVIPTFCFQVPDGNSATRQQQKTEAGQTLGVGGACDQRFAGSNLCEKCSRTNFQSLQCFSVLQWSQRGQATACWCLF